MERAPNVEEPGPSRTPELPVEYAVQGSPSSNLSSAPTEVDYLACLDVPEMERGPNVEESQPNPALALDFPADFGLILPEVDCSAYFEALEKELAANVEEGQPGPSRALELPLEHELQSSTSNLSSILTDNDYLTCLDALEKEQAAKIEEAHPDLLGVLDLPVEHVVQSSTSKSVSSILTEDDHLACLNILEMELAANVEEAQNAPSRDPELRAEYAVQPSTSTNLGPIIPDFDYSVYLDFPEIVRVPNVEEAQPDPSEFPVKDSIQPSTTKSLGSTVMYVDGSEGFRRIRRSLRIMHKKEKYPEKPPIIEENYSDFSPEMDLSESRENRIFLDTPEVEQPELPANEDSLKDENLKTDTSTASESDKVSFKVFFNKSFLAAYMAFHKNLANNVN